MKSSIEYLNEALKVIGDSSNRKAAKRLGIANNSISQYLSGKRTMDNYACFMVAKILGIDPLTCVSSANFEKEKNEEKKQFWLDLWNELDSCNKNKD